MEPISWSVVAALLIKYGPEVADFFVRKWKAGKEVSIEEWNEIRALACKTPQQQLVDAIVRNGLSMDDQHVKNLLSMISPPVALPPVALPIPALPSPGPSMLPVA